MKRIGIIICNYNKKDYVEKCIESLKKQTVKNFDIYVVDNASTDGSVEYLNFKYSNEIELICNEENLGGSGGFNTGIKCTMEKSYPLLMLLDNDVVLARDCIEQILSIMDEDDNIGMLGCEILKMDYPDRIQEFGPTLDYDVMNFICNHGGEKDEGQLPKIKDCDYVPACAMMVRKEVVDKIGLMPQENFIYYDDITWGVMCHRAGYRVAVTSLAKAWHKGGAGINPTTFSNYYLTRNKVRFFMNYMSTENYDKDVTDIQIKDRAEKIIKEIYQGIYACKKKGMPNISKSRMEGFLDALEGVTGKADTFKIRERENPAEKFDKFIENKRTIRLHMHGLWEQTRRIMFRINEFIDKYGREYEVCIVDDDYAGKNMLGVIVKNEREDDKQYDADIHVCGHIYDLQLDMFDKLWMDGWLNVIFDEEDYNSQRMFATSYELFYLCFEDLVENIIKKNLQV